MHYVQYAHGFHFLLVKSILKGGACSPYLAANFGFFELRTFPWSPSKVEVGSKYTYIIIKLSSSVKPRNNKFKLNFLV